MDVQLAREQMIDQQIRGWEVLDARVLSVMAAVPREDFVPDAYRQLAFADTRIPLPEGQVMMTPNVEGRMLQALTVQPGDVALDVGTGSGFSSACLAALGARVTSIEIHASLAERAAAIHSQLGINEVQVDIADAAQLAATDKYDVIAVTGSIPTYAKRFPQALRVGGRLFVIVGDAPVMEAILVTRTGVDAWMRESLFETELAPLENFARPARFEF
ncbi:MAG: protein-L-isoaspartate O-methyltransferase [Gammaproteobacteria bacterium]|nr:protein-L-isoaspartate O-methyltransferase [Gammaproteobacteria bacterium]